MSGDILDLLNSYDIRKILILYGAATIRVVERSALAFKSCNSVKPILEFDGRVIQFCTHFSACCCELFDSLHQYKPSLVSRISQTQTVIVKQSRCKVVGSTISAPFN